VLGDWFRAGDRGAEVLGEAEWAGILNAALNGGARGVWEWWCGGVGAGCGVDRRGVCGGAVAEAAGVTRSGAEVVRGAGASPPAQGGGVGIARSDGSWGVGQQTLPEHLRRGG